MFSEKNENIKFSILVPVYQVEKYVDDCIQSVLNQTYNNWELILVDDGTKDKSGEICDSYAEEYPEKIFVYHKENSGPLHTRIYGIARATGDYCVFLDSDDWLKKNALEVINDVIQKHDCDCVVYGFERVLDGQIIERSSFQGQEECITDKRKLYLKCCMGGYGYLWRKAVKRTAFRDMDYSHYFHIRIMEDDLQSFEIWRNCNKAVFIADRIYQYRINASSLTEKVNIPAKQQTLEVKKIIFDWLKAEDVFTEEDDVEYRKSCQKTIGAYILSVCLIKEPFEKKVELFEELKLNPIYQETVANGRYDKNIAERTTSMILEMFLRKQYRKLILEGKMYHFLKTSRRKIKSLIGKKAQI